MDLDAGKVGQARELWFRLDDEQAGPEAVRTFKAIEESLADRRTQMLRQARTWSNQNLGCLYDLGSARLDRRIGPWNVCVAATSTAQSMVCRSPVSVTTETSNAEHSVQRLARDATRWLYGVWSENRVAPQLAPTCFNDAGIVDVGVAVVRVCKKRLVIDRVFPDEVIISEAEAIAGRLYQAAIKTYRPKHVVLEQYGTDEVKKAAIMETPTEAPGTGSATDSSCNLIPVWECWSLHGKHLVAVPKGTLETEAWPHDFLPLVPMYIDQPVAGWFGRGYVQQLLGYQIELFEINDAIDAHVRLFTSAKWAIEAASGVDADDLDNAIGTILTLNKGAAPPKLLVGEVPKDLLAERQTIYDTALAEIGLNSWSVKGQEPAGRSGVAMEVARDKEQGRLLTAGQNFEDWHVRLAEVCFALGPKTAGTEYRGKGPGDKDLGAVDFRTIAKFLKDKPWRVKVFPISALPDSPQGKRDTVNEWLKLGLITGPVALSLLELPDVDAEASLVSAAREDIMWSIEEILEKGRDGYRPPEPMQDLELGKRMFVSAWLKARRQGVDEDKLDLLAKWVHECQALQQPAPKVPVEQRPGVGTAPAVVEPVNVDGAGIPVPGPVGAEALPPELAAAPPANNASAPPGLPVPALPA
jgi:hypothetical protein